MTTPARKKTIKVTQPQDRKPKATAETEAKQVESYTVNLLDRDWTVDAGALNDFELLEKLAVIDGGGGRAAAVMPAVLRELLGGKQYAEAMDALRDEETGRVPVAEAAEFVMNILGGLDPNS